MKVIGLTGGIASGKSTVSRYLREKGAAILDADAIAHALAEPGGSLYQAYRRHFGAAVLQADGRLDRAAIGKIVFAQPEERAWIDRSAHPLIQAEIKRQLAEKKRQDVPLIVLDVPLLFESGWDKMTEENCLVDVSEAVQLARLMQRDGYDEQAARARIAAQMPLAEKRRRADRLIDNNGDLPATLRQVDLLWKEWTHDGFSQ
ncbi:dephospho-CoA kinase [Selenomonas caprae]|uniref:Dephospho-CoA kinase n=1 Tax=Selenomonas caprae TaxID=2606905 RepID=A0A5D6WLP1_9FIRM|nr:dephospho-CoA kinase [Selenomonas caprae]TYZ28833.1 dephospho-CoA kinase [Selenomonas caprae]